MFAEIIKNPTVLWRAAMTAACVGIIAIGATTANLLFFLAGIVFLVFWLVSLIQYAVTIMKND